jgi:predicted alpha/beta superfamily hydrolase
MIRWMVIALFLSTTLAYTQTPSAAPCKSTVNGDVRFHQLKSEIFGNTRTVRVLVPAGYEATENKDRRYPVLYMFDGQNLFDACLAHISNHEWEIDETVDRLVKDKTLPPLIVVGIDNAEAKRSEEYLPYKDFVGQPDMPEPYGKRLPDFVTKEVMPLVDGQYRTLKGHDNTGIGGSSYGGVASLYALMAKPNAFGYGLIESPVLWIGMGQLVRDTNPFMASPNKIYIAFGGKEIENPKVEEHLIGLVRTVETNLKAAGYNDTNLKVIIDPDAKHTEAAWAKRFPDAVKFLFGDWKEKKGN